ncbi:phenoloxidase 1-like isoform X2 [Harmonia axyridis]|uniref:phenoloxidase 1-like isoform X2 n=1 Tax=Harmonia axyridis TaxID=115357 RepID=UPI001E27819D|nr:phenoloxidase 1-like isoform X2 [Harmonia axyridis]
MSSGTKKHLSLLFDRPQEPVFVAKGDEKVVFDIPNNYLADRYKPIGVQLANRFGEDAGERVSVKQISVPNLGDILDLPRHSNFSLFVPKHRRLAGKLINIFIGVRSVDDLLSVAVYCRDRVNPYLFNYCLSVALLHRADTKDVDIPSFIRSFPDKFVDSQVFVRAREESSIVPEGSRTPIEIPKDYTASNLEDEHRLAYFREDIGINLHHWHWHLVYPFEAAMEVVNKNRRGELFYYMHQQIIARYNFERLCNSLKRVTRFSDWRAPIAEGYFPKMDSLVASRSYPSRVHNQTISDLNRETDQIRQDIDDLVRWRDRIFSAIHAGYVENERGERVQLTENEGIDILGNILESSILSPNRTFYGDLHNMGHIFISYIHDPDHRHLETFGVMGDSATAMRDPIFYRWHAYIDDIFQEFKSTLPRYEVGALDYDGVTISDCSIQTQGAPANTMNTFWQQSDVDLSRGMDFSPRGPVFVRFTHLQHQPFTYTINVNNRGGNRRGTCRIFLAPKFDERGNPWRYRDQRLMFIELDKFPVNLKQGQNTINRASTQSSVTIPFERTFRDLDTSRPQGGEQLAQFNFCGCGWPQHMLIPKGTPEGMPCQLFVMISNYNNDSIDQNIEGPCNDAFVFCGIKDRLYPDRRSMGYPFDREPRAGVNTLQQFLTPNMRVQDVSIKFSNRTLRPRTNMNN